MRGISIAILLVVTMAAFAAGCGNTTNTSSTASGGDITGIWTRILSTSDFQASIKVTFNQDGTFAVESFEYIYGFTNASGHYSPSTDSIYLTDAYCPNSGIYYFSITDNHLSLLVEHESCMKRLIMLGGTWTRLATN